MCVYVQLGECLGVDIRPCFAIGTALVIVARTARVFIGERMARNPCLLPSFLYEHQHLRRVSRLWFRGTPASCLFCSLTSAAALSAAAIGARAFLR